MRERHLYVASVSARNEAPTASTDETSISGTGLRPATRAPARAYAVDALRGLAFIFVVLGGTKPYGVLPDWMYHAQYPPPRHEYVAIPGLTYPDVVLAFFLFTMGVAIPLALGRRLDRGTGLLALLRKAVVVRFALLMFLALFREHFDSAVWPVLAHKPERYAWILGLLAFPVLFAIFYQTPAHWSRRQWLALRAAGWGGAVLMFAFTQFPDGTRIRPHQFDPILVINAYCVAGGTLIWLATRRNLMARLGVLAFLVVLRMNDGEPGWIDSLSSFRPWSGAYELALFYYLCITIPGTIAGDLFVAWSTAPEFDGARPALFVTTDEPQPKRAWSPPRALTVACLLVLCIPVLLVGIQGRYVFLTTMILAGLCVAVLELTSNPESATERLVSQLVRWGAFWLLLGLFLDPVEGGTFKEPPTFAWMFQSCGLALFVLTVFVIVINIFHRQSPVQLLIDNGQNPLIAYVGYGMIMLPLLGLSGIKNRIESREPPAWGEFAWSIIVMLAVIHIVQFCTRRKLFWRT